MAKQFEKLVNEAVKSADEADKYSGKPRLSASAFLAMALAMFATTKAELHKLKKQMSANPDKFEQSFLFLKRATRYVREGDLSEPCDRPLILRWLSQGENELTAVNTELFQINFDAGHLQALAILEATEKHPDIFGNVDSLEAYNEKRADALAKRTVLFERVSKEFTADDLTFVKNEAYFRAGGGQVPVVPLSDVGERLTNHMKNYKEAVAA